MKTKKENRRLLAHTYDSKRDDSPVEKLKNVMLYTYVEKEQHSVVDVSSLCIYINI